MGRRCRRGGHNTDEAVDGFIAAPLAFPGPIRPHGPRSGLILPHNEGLLENRVEWDLSKGKLGVRKLLQETTREDGLRIVVNFAQEPRSLPDGTVITSRDFRLVQ